MTANDPRTEELLQQAAKGDGDAVQQLLGRHRERLRRMVSVRMDPRLCARFDPSDIIQETMARAYCDLPDYLERRPCGFYPWLRQIAWQRLVELHRRHVLAQRRSVKREARWDMPLSDGSATLLAEQLAASATSVGARMVREEMLVRVRRALDQLPHRDSEAIILRHLEQLSLREVGDVLGISHVAARLRYWRALERLHELLGDGSEGTQ